MKTASLSDGKYLHLYGVAPDGDLFVWEQSRSRWAPWGSSLPRGPEYQTMWASRERGLWVQSNLSVLNWNPRTLNWDPPPGFHETPLRGMSGVLSTWAVLGESRVILSSQRPGLPPVYQEIPLSGIDFPEELKTILYNPPWITVGGSDGVFYFNLKAPGEGWTRLNLPGGKGIQVYALGWDPRGGLWIGGSPRVLYLASKKQWWTFTVPSDIREILPISRHDTERVYAEILVGGERGFIELIKTDGSVIRPDPKFKGWVGNLETLPDSQGYLVFPLKGKSPRDCYRLQVSGEWEESRA